MTIIDLSYGIQNSMPLFCGDPSVELSDVVRFETDGYRLTRLTCGLHSGTHVDFPAHMIKDGNTASDYDISHFCGRGVVLNCIGFDKITYRVEYEALVRQGDCVLVVTSFADLYDSPEEYFKKYPAVDLSFAKFLVRKKVKLLALDTPSPDYAPFEVHKFLLSGGVMIAENLRNLESLKGKRFDFYCPPIQLDAEAGLCRAFAVLKDGYD